MTQFTIPKGAEYFTTGYCGDAPTFWRRRFTHYNSLNEERLQPMYVVQVYDNGRWEDDSSASLRRARPISLFNNWNPAADCDD